MLFYKFQKPGNIQFAMLRRGELFFASPSELNDPNECRPRLVLNGSAELWRRLAGFLLERLCFCSDLFPHTDVSTIDRAISATTAIGAALKKKARLKDIELTELADMFQQTAEPLLKEAIGSQLSLQASRWLGGFIEHDLQRFIAQERYIASFCSNATNPTMWGHYADAERGFAVVYTTSNEDSISVNSPAPVFNGTRPSKDQRGITEIGIYKEEKLKLVRVKYATKPPKVNAFLWLIPKFHYSENEEHYDVPLLLPGDAAKKQESMIGLLKYSEWRYEREVRAFFPTHQRLRPDARAVRVASENIKGLIFGPNMSRENMIRAVVCAHLMRLEFGQPAASPFMFFSAKRSPDRFRLSIEPEGILHGLYHGDHIPIKTVNDMGADEAREIRAAATTIASS